MIEEPTHRGLVLIADDEEMVRIGLSEFLRREGFATADAATSDEALAQLHERDFDAVISDIHMPGNSRLEMIASIREIDPVLPVIVLTGLPTVETAARSVRMPVTAYLTKPPDMAELVTMLDKAVADYRSMRALQAGRARLRAWESEIEQIERSLHASAKAEAGGPMGSYLRLTLRQVILMLSDLEQAAVGLEQGGTAVRVDHEAALRRTVEVLERTKQNFKSKELADLRKQIEQVLRQGAPKEQTAPRPGT
jgi:YesN/AraC family two-component response regulator